MAPEDVQIAAKCIVGRDYPVPMVDHTVVSRINTERLRQVYQQLYRQYEKGMTHHITRYSKFVY